MDADKITLNPNDKFSSQSSDLVNEFVSSGSFDRQLSTLKDMSSHEKEQLSHEALDSLAEKVGFDLDNPKSTVQDFFNALVTDESQKQICNEAYPSPALALNNFLIAGKMPLPQPPR